VQGDDVLGDGLRVAAVRRAGLAPMLLFALQPLFPHQTGAAAFARARPTLLQVHEDARHSIGAPARSVGRRDLRRDGCVLALPGTRPLLAPAVVPAVR